MSENSTFKTKYLKDYKKPDYLINSTNLTFEISPNLTKVTSILEIEDTLLSQNNKMSNYFDLKSIEKILKRHCKGIDNRKPLWAIYMLYKNFEKLSKP